MIVRINIFYYTVIFLLLLSMDTIAQQLLWRLAKGTENVYTAAIASSWGRPETLYALGARQTSDHDGYGIFLRSIDGGETWDSISSMGADMGALKVDPSSAQIIYVSHPGLDPSSNDVSMSTDGGVTWNYVWHGRMFPASVIEVDPVDRTTIYAMRAPGYLWYTTDHGQSWQWTGDSVVSFPTSMVIDPTNDSIMWTSGTLDVRKSIDRGVSFIPVLSNPWGAWSQLAINPKDPNIVYVSFFDTLAGVFKTTDGGVSWQDANGDLPPINRMLWRIAIDPRNPEIIFLGSGTPTLDTNEILFRSTDGGMHWSAFSEGLPDSLGHVESILIDTLTNKIFVGVGTRFGQSGLYVCNCLTSVDTDSPTTPESFALFQNYPNPFNPSTTIEFYLPHQDYITLDVVDLLGRTVSTIVNGNLELGNHRARLDAATFSSGVYLYRLRTSNGIFIKKMMILR